MAPLAFWLVWLGFWLAAGFLAGLVWLLAGFLAWLSFFLVFFSSPCRNAAAGHSEQAQCRAGTSN